MREQLDVVAALVRASFLVNAVYGEAAREHGLTQQQGQLLCVLMKQAYGMGELSSTLGLAKSSLSGLVDRTERNGLVERAVDSQDTRAVRVRLTPRGRRVAGAFYDDACRRIESLTAGLSADERSALTGSLGGIVFSNAVPVVFPST
ncbi:MarR family transcriptional regulator [Actinoplanes sp. NBRC 103695]|uniref:MarR family winged helix-turn-helix transcriptional regulator n=1 Tax=Actinoplanes sp. NBRC 103695 TaxID=3032202 RepID=UPI0024A3E575|nr:MarR family transcriptional regulator [Actinoplanes sp. NBRC 103695]GLZ00380.1 MarR family transcriptional regulator [Actinoplanes sp. NBRC 103695]